MEYARCEAVVGGVIRKTGDTRPIVRKGSVMQHQKDVAHLIRRVSTGSVKATAHFYADQSCIGCGRCARLCPADAIAMDAQRRPHWIRERCFACLGCLRGCPVEAITYGMHEHVS